MKKMFLILLISFSAHASNWMPASKIQPGQTSGFQLESECERVSNETCVDVGNNVEAVALGFASVKDDWGPELQVEVCEGQEACQSLLEAKVCEVGEKFIDADYSKVYCVELLGKVLDVDTVAITAHEAAKAIQAAEKAAEQNALSRAECGRTVIAKLLVRNAPKGLSKQQVKELSATYAFIQGLLLNGSLETAREEILAVPADGVVVTQADKDALVAKLDSCKPQ